MRPNKDFYTKLLDNLMDGVYFVDPNRSITYWNKGAELLTGFKSSEMVGKHCFADLLTHVDDHGTTLCSRGCPLQKSISDSTPSTAEVYLRHKDGIAYLSRSASSRYRTHTTASKGRLRSSETCRKGPHSSREW